MPQLAHKIKLYPNEETKGYFIRACGIARFAYNWALTAWKEKYNNGEKGMSGYSLCKEFNAIKATQFPWVYEVTKWAPQKAIYNLEDAFKRFFKKLGKYPKLKKKGISQDSFYVGLNDFKVKGRYLKIPNLDCYIKMAKPIRFKGELKAVTISRTANEWFASFSVKIPDDTYSYPHECKTQAVVGVDLGIRALAVCSDGTRIENPRPLKKAIKKLRKMHKEASRKQKGSSNRKKACMRLAKAYQKVTDVRNNTWHQLTSWLVKNFCYIGIEDLNVKGMMKSRNMAKAIADASFYEFRRELGYKTKLAGSNLVLVDRFFPSSKKCSVCGYINKELKRGDEYWVCPICGTMHERDDNSSMNLEFVARGYRDTLNACGGGVRLVLRNENKQFPLKQESESELYVY